jgi:hypothetical protein
LLHKIRDHCGGISFQHVSSIERAGNLNGLRALFLDGIGVGRGLAPAAVSRSYDTATDGERRPPPYARQVKIE